MEIITVVEEDTNDQEDIVNLFEFLVPLKSSDGSVNLNQFATFGLHYKQALFSAWIKQTSAFCAAAVVIGAHNALLKINRNSSAATHYQKVLDIYSDLVETRMNKKIASFERKLGTRLGAEDFWDPFEKHLKEMDRYLGGKKGSHVTKLIMIRAIKKAVKEYSLQRSLVNNGDVSTTENNLGCLSERTINRNIWACLSELIEEENIMRGKGKDNEDEDQEENDDEEEEGNDIEDENGFYIHSDTQNNRVHAVKSGSKFKGSISKPQSDKGNFLPEIVLVSAKANLDEMIAENDTLVNANNQLTASSYTKPDLVSTWKAELFDIMKDKSGLNKLRAAKPSTAIVGNWGILQAFEALSRDDTNNSFHARLFMGKKRSAKSKIDVAVSKKDNAATIQQQWDALRSAYTATNQVLIFHLKNHYALIFALREYSLVEEKTSKSSSTEPQSSDRVASETEVVREVLTARKGQRPTAWLRFEEVRETLLSWDGYKIIAVSHTNS